MHHAVSSHQSPSLTEELQTKADTSPQMIDKVWYDWQNAHPENFWSFAGGSVSFLIQPDLSETFPTGGPPFLNVSEGLTLPAPPLCCGRLKCDKQFNSPIATDGILQNATIFQVMDTKDERLCYVYE